MKWCCIIPCLLLLSNLQGQEQPFPETEQQLENVSENEENTEPTDDSWWQQLEYRKTAPLNINNATAADLMELQILTALQVNQLLQYRKLLGNLISIYELQSVPGWDIPLIQMLLPYITVATPTLTRGGLLQSVREGKHSVVMRYSRSIENARGYLKKDSAETGYAGDPSKLMIRYGYRYKNLLRYGITFSKDAGERLLSGAAGGFDFYSFHLFVKKPGMVNTIALGDYTINIGQGLIHWQGLSFGKGGSIMHVKKQSPVLRPYSSSGAFYFHRGAAVQLVKRYWVGTFYISHRKLDANVYLNPVDETPVVSSIQTSGYHRTPNEIDDRGALKQFVYGTSLNYTNGNASGGINMVQYHFSLPLEKKNTPYSLFALSGKQHANYSIDYSYTLKNFHFFGETATDSRSHFANIHGLLASVHPKADISLLYRNIATDYQAFFGNAFTVGTTVSNERGLYVGLALKPAAAWTFNFYTDIFRFPWLKYRVDAPSSGKDYFVDVKFQPSKYTEIYSRYRTRQKFINQKNDTNALEGVVPYVHRSWRTQVNHRVSKNFTVRHRFELLWYSSETATPEKGFLAFFDLFYKPLQSPLSINMRLQYFESTSYNSRLYAYENDVLYYYSVPVFYDKGTRYYVNVRYKLNRQINIWAKWAQTIYNNRDSIGSGLDEIHGNKKSEIRVMLAVTL